MTWDLIIFDCDGVLVDSEPIANRLFEVMLGEIGLRITYEETLQQFMGCSMPTWVALIEQRLGRPVPPGFVADFYARLDAAFRRELRAVPGILSALDRIFVQTCVASNATLTKMWTSLGLAGLLPRFEGRLFSATEVERGKPFPDLFLYAAQCMGAIPAHCAVIEDSPLGVQAGIAAGMHVFGYTGLSRPETLAAAGARVFCNMEDLPELLQAAAGNRRSSTKTI
jgi:HAD superfamily hydrolase (TIGR01509 family)